MPGPPVTDAETLYKIVAAHDWSHALHLIRQGYPLDYRDPEEYGCHAIHIAAFWGAPQVVRELIDRGVDGDLPLTDGCTPLHLACCQFFDGVPEVVRILLKAGADVNAVTNRGATPLYLAAGHAMYEENHQMVLELLAHGADPNLQSPTTGLTPLHVARPTRTIQVLLDAGANPRIRDHEGRTPAEYQAEEDNLEEAEYLRKVAPGT